MNKFSYKPPYVWPAPTFPFRLYFDDPRLRIFIIESLRNNWDWLLKYHQKIKPTDVFLVISGWHQSEATAKDCKFILETLDLRIENFLFMAGSAEELSSFKKYDLYVDLLPQNAWLDSEQVMKPKSLAKEFDAIYVGRRTAFKRHMLASNIDSLAIIAGNNHGNDISELPQYTYINERQLSPEEVSDQINKSRCGLILSEVEGGCFASSEYLMCGVPVVSTHSKGGRDYWYNDYNSIVVDPDPAEIRKAVDFFKHARRSSEIISKTHKAQSDYIRLQLMRHLDQIFCRHDLGRLDACKYFYDNFFHKLRKSICPNFEEIFA
jgi:glycosyltransferase involved in cell wall biosynthesis